MIKKTKNGLVNRNGLTDKSKNPYVGQSVYALFTVVKGFS